MSTIVFDYLTQAQYSVGASPPYAIQNRKDSTPGLRVFTLLDSPLLQTPLDWIRRLEDLRQLLERVSRRLHEPLPDHKGLDAVPAHKHQIIPPADALHRDGRCERVDAHGDVDEQVREAGALRARLRLEHLDAVERLQRRVRPRVHGAEQVDEHDDCGCRALVVAGRRGGRRDDGEAHRARGSCPDQHLPPPELVEQRRAPDGREKAQDRVDPVQHEPGVGRVDARLREHRRHVVGHDVVAGPLPEEGHTYCGRESSAGGTGWPGKSGETLTDEAEPVPRSPRVHEVAVVPPDLVRGA